MTVGTAVDDGRGSSLPLGGLDRNPRTERVAACGEDVAAEYDRRAFFDVADVIADLDWAHVRTPVRPRSRIDKTLTETVVLTPDADLPLRIPATDPVRGGQSRRRTSERAGDAYPIDRDDNRR